MVQQTNLHCELTGLNVLRSLSGKPEPVCLNAESDSELLSVSLKSPAISSMTGISEERYTPHATAVQHHNLACPANQHQPACERGGAHLQAHKHTQMKLMQIEI